MSLENPFYQIKVKEELARRIESNSRYSLRAFARAMDLAPSALSEILSGKRIPSLKASHKIIKTLGLSPDEQDNFLSSIGKEHQHRGLKRLSPQIRGLSSSTPKLQPKLTSEMFRVLGDWYHVAILELTYLKDFRLESSWISKQLGISATESKLAIERLKDLGLIKKVRTRWVKSTDHLTTTDKKITSSAHKRFQKQCLEKAVFSLENHDLSLRNMTTLTVAVHPEKISQAKALITRFNREMNQLFDEGEKTAVYNFTVSLYPISKTNFKMEEKK